jgi:O-antigen ligase
MSIRAWMSTETMEKGTFACLAMFALVSSCSVALGNVFLGLSLLFGLGYLYMDFSSKKRGLPPKGILAVILLLWAAVLFSALFSADVAKGIGTFFDKYFYRSAPLFLILFAVRKPEKIVFLAKCLLASVLINGCAAVYQFVAAGMVLGGRYAGFLNYMHYATILSMTFLCLWIGVLKDTVPRRRCLWGALMAVAGGLLLIDYTRGAWLGAAIGMLVLGLFAVRQRLKMLMAYACVLAVAMGLMASFPEMPMVQRIVSVADSTEQSHTERKLLWQSAEQMFEDNPLLGIGPGRFKDCYPDYISPLAKEPHLTHAHSNFMNMLAEGGAVGELAFLIFVFYLLYFSVSRRERHGETARLCIMAAVLGLMLHGLTEYTWGASVTMKFFWTVLGLVLAWMRIHEGTAE